MPCHHSISFLPRHSTYLASLEMMPVLQISKGFDKNCMARQCSLLRQKFMECSIINPALLLLMKHLVIGQCRRAPNFSAFHWAPHGSLVSIGRHFVTTRVVHLPNRTETSLITKSDRSGPNHRIGPGCAGHA